MTNMFEGDNETPWLTPKELHKLGFSMILYPTSLLFPIVKTLQLALERLRHGKQASAGESVTLNQYEEIVGLAHWSEIEERFHTEEKQND
jgi:2-methylisocitrate lyase-like PEP mutase family enzyme